MSEISVPTEQVRVRMTGGPMGGPGVPGPPGPGGSSYIPVSSVADSNKAITGLQTIDGVAGSVNQRVLLVNQGIGSQNGIWLQQVGAWTRPTDYATTTIVAAFNVAVLKGGIAYGGSMWALLTTGATIDTTATVWQEVSSLNTVFTFSTPFVGANPKPPYLTVPFRGAATTDAFGNRAISYGGITFPNGVLDVEIGLTFSGGSFPSWFLAQWAWSLTTVTCALVQIGAGPLVNTGFGYHGVAIGW